ncbi:hypothetical protein BG005_011496 [Podila minutissima]|nr:hypothetical protein BG005_011496 [Podila minutissima]
MQKLIVLCDRTWFESEKHTQSNIFRLAKLIGIDMTQQTLTRTEPILYHDDRRCIRACYFPGSGLDETFLKYLFRDVTVDAIHNDCIEVYKYIVDHYTPGTEIWMFGLSCGAYTVRCVAGMINNCGILRQTIDTGPIDLDWCRRVYGIYRSRRHDDHPKDPSILSFKSQFSYNEPMPVKFMGLLDTVGNLGVPTFDEDNRLTLSEYYRRTLGEYSRRIFGEYNRRTLGEDNGPTLNTFLGLPEFYDRKVSSVVEKVLLHFG